MRDLIKKHFTSGTHHETSTPPTGRRKQRDPVRAPPRERLVDVEDDEWEEVPSEEEETYASYPEEEEEQAYPDEEEEQAYDYYSDDDVEEEKHVQSKSQKAALKASIVDYYNDDNYLDKMSAADRELEFVVRNQKHTGEYLESLYTYIVDTYDGGDDDDSYDDDGSYYEDYEEEPQYTEDRNPEDGGGDPSRDGSDEWGLDDMGDEWGMDDMDGGGEEEEGLAEAPY